MNEWGFWVMGGGGDLGVGWVGGRVGILDRNYDGFYDQ